MGIKEQVEFAKEELTQDEKLLAGLIKVERFYKRNRIPLLGVAAALTVGTLFYGVTGYIEQQRLERANAAFLKLEQNPADQAALKTLKSENPKLAALFLLDHAVKAGDVKQLEGLVSDKDETVADLAAYHVAALKRESEKLKAYRMRSEALLKDFALFDEGYLLMRQGKVAEGRKRLAAIEKNSPLARAAAMLAHYGLTQTKD
ncbi:MAG: tetratricopeptide repeat protein [Epsilonproteobacteria bacterium]|nr:tetratricopeptide repeat protein [Campylobacterota bacterium]